MDDDDIVTSFRDLLGLLRRDPAARLRAAALLLVAALCIGAVGVSALYLW